MLPGPGNASHPYFGSAARTVMFVATLRDGCHGGARRGSNCSDLERGQATVNREGREDFHHRVVMNCARPKTMENKLPSPMPPFDGAQGRLPAWERVRVRAARWLPSGISKRVVLFLRGSSPK